MPGAPTYPGIYIEEIPTGMKSIPGVATSVTAFIGRAGGGPVNEPIQLASFGDYERRFGCLDAASAMGYAVRDFYLNGGSIAVVVRVLHDDARPATITVNSSDGSESTLVLRLLAVVARRTDNQVIGQGYVCRFLALSGCRPMHAI
jgi:phage tail sheath protein FI